MRFMMYLAAEEGAIPIGRGRRPISKGERNKEVQLARLKPVQTTT
jgi:hypothetical protein